SRPLSKANSPNDGRSGRPKGRLRYGRAEVALGELRFIAVCLLLVAPGNERSRSATPVAGPRSTNPDCVSVTAHADDEVTHLVADRRERNPPEAGGQHILLRRVQGVVGEPLPSG